MLRNRSHLSDNQGFTLVELLMAVTIFAIGLLTVAGMQVTAIKANSTADNISVATAVAQGVFEDLMSREPDDHLFDATALDQAYSLDSSSMSLVPGGDKYRARYDVTVDTPTAGLVRIDVTITGHTRIVTMCGFKRVL